MQGNIIKDARYMYKVPKGKLVRVCVSAEDGKVTDICVTGDFFVYPEERIETLEQEIRGLSIDENLAQEIRRILERYDIVLFGLDAAALAHAITMAVA